MGIAVLKGRNHRVRGSVTPEASLGLFLFLMFFITILYFYQVMTLELRVQSALEETLQVESAFCMVGEIQKDDVSTLGCELSKVFVKANIVRLLSVDYLNRSWIQSGSLGISVNQSKLLEDGETIELVADYKIKVPLLPGIRFRVSQQASGRIWVGDSSGNTSADASGEATEEVYVTAHGTAYHLYEDCSYIDVKVTSVSSNQLKELRNESGGIYYPCEYCNPTGDKTVFITKYGTRYHSSESCSALERDVETIEAHEVGERHLCKKCQQRKENEG